MMSRSTLTVRWSKSEPPIAATTWQRLQAPPGGEAGDQELEGRLGWPPGTLAALRRAFERRLTRDIGWQDAAPGPEPSPIAAAARVFRRGVAHRSATGSPTTGTQTGSYPIEIMPADDLPESFAALPFAVVDRKVAGLW